MTAPDTATSTGTAVRLDAVSVDYGAGRVVDEVDLAVDVGEWVALIGPNGAGKSSLLGVLSGLVTHTGRVRLGGTEPSTWHQRQWARAVALVPQRPIIPPGLTVTDYVLLGRTAHIRTFGVETPADLVAVADVLDRLDLAAFAHRDVLHLSGGELQRVVLARALVQEADLLLLDEPTAALDIGHGQHVLELVDDLRTERGLTVISAMHDLTLAGQYADRLVLLDQGVAVADGPAHTVLTADLLARHYHAAVRILDDEGSIVVAPVRGNGAPAPTSNPTTPTTPTGDAP